VFSEQAAPACCSGLAFSGGQNDGPDWGCGGVVVCGYCGRAREWEKVGVNLR
jgi:hypothetical protein